MADEQYKWLDGDAAERLLRGEPLDAVDDDTRAHADRLAEALAALAATPLSTGAELPGEAEALAAFRTVRTARDGERTTPGRPVPRQPAAHSLDAGLVRLGRPATGGRKVRWGRPVRFGLAAAVAAAMIGGVAVAAGTGILRTPFGDEPGPAASVSAAVNSQQPLLTPTPSGSETDGSPSVTPGGTSGAPTQGDSSHDEANAGSRPSHRIGSTDNGTDGRNEEWWTRVRSSCRDLVNGRDLGTRRLRGLEDAAGGSGRVKEFCTGVLGRGEDRTHHGGEDAGTDGNGSSGKDGGDGDQGGSAGDGEGHIWPGGNSLVAPPTAKSRAPASVLPDKTASPSPTYSALSPSDGQ
ncbi:hypothetical protein ABZ468_13015 [Streptomyces sp. NPDC005708]|uniref:hypothetical protein n=1 Tax=Streptomyces sp. NPDC005708 TaxID=3154564 RepID=UPI0033EF2270